MGYVMLYHLVTSHNCVYHALQVQRSSKTLSLAKDKVLRGPLVFPRFDKAQPFFSSRSSSPSFFHIGPHCNPNFMVSEPLMATENDIGSILNFETVDA